jgi:hypothetical protein
MLPIVMASEQKTHQQMTDQPQVQSFFETETPTGIYHVHGY